jgi:hypothetical protein
MAPILRLGAPFQELYLEPLEKSHKLLTADSPFGLAKRIL